MRILTWFSPCIWGFADHYPRVRNFLHGTWFGRKVVDTFWGILGNDIITLNGYEKHPEMKKLKPWSDPFFLGSSLSTLNYDTDFFSFVRDGRVKIHIAEVSSLTSHSIHISDSQKLPAHALAYATRWKHRPPITFLLDGIDSQLGLPGSFDNIQSEKMVARADSQILDTFPRLKNQELANSKAKHVASFSSDVNSRPYRLYRFMVPPQQDRTIAFTGALTTISTSIVASVQALWIAEYFDTKLDLPTEQDKITYETILHSQFCKWRYPRFCDRFPDFVFDALPYVDLMLQELGLRSHRKNGKIAEILEPYGPEDYRGLVDEWKETHSLGSQKE
jgi:hypothetical protein